MTTKIGEILKFGVPLIVLPTPNKAPIMGLLGAFGEAQGLAQHCRSEDIRHRVDHDTVEVHRLVDLTHCPSGWAIRRLSLFCFTTKMVFQRVTKVWKLRWWPGGGGRAGVD